MWWTREIYYTGRNRVKIKKGIAKNMEPVGYHDMEDRPGFQMAMQVVDNRWYLYCAHYRVVGQFQFKRFKMSSISQSRSVTPAFIAGVTLKV
jgi:hypothetical protein